LTPEEYTDLLNDQILAIWFDDEEFRRLETLNGQIVANVAPQTAGRKRGARPRIAADNTKQRSRCGNTK